ncbi:MAG: uracil-DNA glycosylase [Alphaproteobacteria bacterium]|nr:uracil-DNA glycosylase [Alphaproteobacteria bacterium]
MIQAPDHNCPFCPRLVGYRTDNRAAFPDKHNGPVPSFGPLDARLLVVGLAPGLRGANFTGRPFTGDWAGDLLYGTFLKVGLATGQYLERPDDGLALVGCRITNAVRCVPPENKPLPEEAAACQPFLKAELAGLPNLKVLLAQGKIAHDAVLRAMGLKLSAYPFIHGREHKLPNGLTLVDTYHCSRYNTNTGRLTEAMFEAVVRQCMALM